MKQIRHCCHMLLCSLSAILHTPPSINLAFWSLTSWAELVGNSTPSLASHPNNIMIQFHHVSSMSSIFKFDFWYFVPVQYFQSGRRWCISLDNEWIDVKIINLKVMSTHCKFKRLKILMVTIKKHSTTNMTLGDPMLTDNPTVKTLHCGAKCLILVQ